jgi:hypothetical protein
MRKKQERKLQFSSEVALNVLVGSQRATFEG